jgi:predicted nucleic acid-binding protein
LRPRRIDALFVDTNVLVYASDNRETIKQSLAEQCLERLWREQSGRTSVQVLNECYWTLTHKVRPALPANDAWDIVSETRSRSGCRKLPRNTR